MDRGIVILALGDNLYGKMAVTLAASIKAKSKIPIQLVYNNTAIKEIPKNRLNLFSKLSKCSLQHYTHNGDKEYQKAKLYLNEYSVFDKTLYLDADTIICPGRKVDDWFEELNGNNITFQNNGYYDLWKEEESKKGYLYWGDPHEISMYHKLERYLPKVCSTFMYWESWSFTQKSIFEEARRVYEDDGCPVQEWNGGKPDEYCFNVSLALHDMLPHKVPFLPIHFIHLHNAKTKEEIIGNFIGMSNCGNKVPKFLSEIYNDFVDYYFDLLGFKEKYYHQDKCEVLDTRKKM